MTPPRTDSSLLQQLNTQLFTASAGWASAQSRIRDLEAENARLDEANKRLLARVIELEQKERDRG